jgi:hypothetical protein
MSQSNLHKKQKIANKKIDDLIQSKIKELKNNELKEENEN